MVRSALCWVLSLALVSVVACSDEEKKARGQINIIAVLPLGGAFSAKGDFHKAGIQLALLDLEAAGLNDELDKSFRVIPVSSANGTTAVELEVASILEKEGAANIAAIISSTGSAHEGSLPLAMEHHIPHFEISSGSSDTEFIDATASGYDMSYAFSTRPWCYYLAQMGGDFLAGNTSWGDIAMIRGGEAHDIVHTSGTRTQLGTVHGQSARVIDSGETGALGDFIVDTGGSFQASIEAIMAAHNPGVLWFHLRGDTHNLRFLQDAQRAGFTGKIATCNMSRTPAIIDNAQNGGISDYLVDRLFYVSRGPTKGALLTAFKANFLDVFGVDADTFTASAYDATVLIGLAIAVAGDAKDHAAVRDAVMAVAKDGTEVTYGNLDQAVKLISAGTDIDYRGASGSLDFRADRSVPGDYYVEGVISPSASSYSYQELSTPARTEK